MIDATTPFTESTWIQFRVKGGDKVTAGCVYRSPNSSDENNRNLISLMNKIATPDRSHLLIMGDFNLPGIDWDEDSCPHNEAHIETLFLESIRDTYLYQHVTEPTRVKVDQQPNILDLILTNEEGMVSDLSIEAPIQKSDHATLWFTFNTHTAPSKTHTKRIYDKGDYDKMKKMLSKNWKEELGDLDPEQSWQKFLRTLKDAETKCIPSKTYKEGPNKIKALWMNKDINSKMRRKHKAWNRYRRTHMKEDYDQYAKARNQARNATRKGIKTLEKKIAKDIKQNPKAFWRYVNSKTKTKKTICDLEVTPGGKLSESDTEKAEALNAFFSSVFTHEDLKNIPTLEPRNYKEKLTSLNFTIDDVMTILAKMKIAKSPGPDGVHPRILKECSEAISEALYIIFRKSMDTATIPDDWREAKITPIHKKGSRRSPSNYRPISLTSIVCKMMERIVRDGLVRHMKANNLFSDHQHGFVGGRSCITQLLETMELWTKILDEGGSLDVIYLDFLKAFDTVPHARLLVKLEAYGISGPLLEWIRDFLHNRRQRVVVNGAESSWSPVTSGIPQGSVLGPILFVIYINDLPEATSCPSKLFADDTKTFRKIQRESDCEELQNDLNALDEWSRMWQLKFNASKCKHMRIGNVEGCDAQYRMWDSSDTTSNKTTILERTKLEKDLGVYTDDQLKFSSHISKVSKTCNNILGIIRRTFHHLDGDTVVRLYKALIRPRLEYGNIIWNPMKEKDIHSIESIQRRATKMIPGLTDMTYEERLKTLKLPTLVYRRMRGDIIEAYKLVTKKYDLSKELLHPATYKSTRGNTLKLEKTRSITQTRQNFFTQRVINTWNALPEEVVSASSTNVFKNRIDNLWKTHPKLYDFKFRDPPGCAPIKFKLQLHVATSAQDNEQS